MSGTDQGPRNRLVSVTLDEASIGRSTADKEHERQIAIYDLLEENTFGVPGHDAGPYGLKIALQDFKARSRNTRREQRPSCRAYIVSDPAAGPSQRLLFCVRKLLRRDPDRDAGTDRSHRYGSPGAPQ